MYRILCVLMLSCIFAVHAAEKPQPHTGKISFVSLGEELTNRKLAKLSEEQLRTAFEKGVVVARVPRLGTTLWPITEYAEAKVEIKSKIFWNIKELGSSWHLNMSSVLLSLTLLILISASSQGGQWIIVRPGSLGMICGFIVSLILSSIFPQDSTAGNVWMHIIYLYLAFVAICMAASKHSEFQLFSWSAVIICAVYQITIDITETNLVLKNLFHLIVLCYSIEVMLVLWRKYKKSLKHP